MTRKRADRPAQGKSIDQKIELDGKAQVGKIIQIGSLVIDASDPRQIRRLLYAGLVATLVLGGLIVATYLLQRRQIIANHEKPSGPMTGVFNVAVVPFLQQDDAGFGLPSQQGSHLARMVYEALVPVEAALKKSKVDFEVRSPDDIEGPDEGGINLDLLEPWVDDLAHDQDLKADLLIYGYILKDGQSLYLAMYLDGGRLRNAEDLTDHYPLGELPTPGEGILANPAADQEVRNQLGALSGALARFALGLGYYAMADIKKAQYYFDEAQTEWPEEIGKEEAQADQIKETGKQALYLFQSKVAGLYGDLTMARKYLEKALVLNDQYGRAWLGLGQLDYLQSIVDCDSGQVNLQGMESAIRSYERAVELSKKVPEAYISIKADYYLGRVYQCISPAEDHWQEAQQKYWSVICTADVESSERAECQGFHNLPESNSILDTLAANAYRDLAILIWNQNPGDPVTMDRVEEYFRRAIDLTSHPNRLALLYTWMADVHWLKGDCPQAKENLTKAGKYYEQFTRQDDRLKDNSFEKFFNDVKESLQANC